LHWQSSVPYPYLNRTAPILAINGTVGANFRIKKDSLCASPSKSARVEPKATAQPLFSDASARCWLIDPASFEPPVMELTKKGACNGLSKNRVPRSISLKSISGNSL